MTEGRLCDVEECPRPHLALGFCKSHYRRFKRYGDPLHIVPSDLAPAKVGYRVCNKCEEEKPLEEYPKDSRSLEGRKRVCSTCTNSYLQVWASENYDRTKDARRRAVVLIKYGEAGVAAFDRIMAGEGCDICHKVRPRMAIDHDHITGFVRGILCSNCNTALGLVGEDYAVIVGMMDYLVADRHDYQEVTRAYQR